jgi:hypothetical protein
VSRSSSWSEEVEGEQKERARRCKCWKGRQKRRWRTWSLLNLSGLHAMYWHKSADTLATHATTGLFITMSRSLCLPPPAATLPAFGVLLAKGTACLCFESTTPHPRAAALSLMLLLFYSSAFNILCFFFLFLSFFSFF